MIPSPGWTIGVGRLGPPPKEPHKHPRVATIITSTVARKDWYSDSAKAALDARVKRFREMKTPHTVTGLSVRFVDPTGASIELSYQDLEGPHD